MITPAWRKIMFSLINGVDSIVTTVSPVQTFGAMCYPCQIGYKAFHLAHFYFHCIQRSFYWSKGDAGTIGGDIFNFTFGDRYIVQKACQTILVARAVLRSNNAQKEVAKSCAQLNEAFTASFPVPSGVAQMKDAHSWSPIDTLSSLPQSVSNLVLRIETILARTWHVLQNLFWLSFSSVEILDALMYDRYTQFMSISGVWQNGKEVVDELSKHLGDVAEEIQENNKVVTDLLKVTKSTMTAEDLTRELRSYIEHGKNALKASAVGLDSIAQAAQDVAQEAQYLATGQAAAPQNSETSQKNHGNQSSSHSSRKTGRQSQRYLTTT